MGASKLFKIACENILLEEKQMDWIAMVDCDGVLADFDKAIKIEMAQNERLQQIKKDYKETLGKFPEFANLSSTNIKLKQTMAGEQTDPELKKLKKVWRKYNDAKYTIASRPGFFLNLEELPGAREMLIQIREIVGKKTNILTAPMRSHPNCEKEKREWIKKHFSGLYDRFICSSNKEQYATPNTILIDDRTKQTIPFEEAGGIAILHKNPQETIRKLKEIILGEEELEEQNVVGAGAVSGFSLPLGMKPDYEKMRDNKKKNIKEENVLDKMGKKKVAKKMRRGFVGDGVYTEFPSDKEEKIVKKVTKNLHRKPYSHNPPTLPISEISSIREYKEMTKKTLKEIIAYMVKEEMDLSKMDIASVSKEEAKKIGDRLGVDWDRIDLIQLKKGIFTEFEHTSDPFEAARIAIDHIKELPDYYDRLERLEAEGEKELEKKSKK